MKTNISKTPIDKVIKLGIDSIAEKKIFIKGLRDLKFSDNSSDKEHWKKHFKKHIKSCDNSLEDCFMRLVKEYEKLKEGK
jgi:hypothetical protein